MKQERQGARLSFFILQPSSFILLTPQPPKEIPCGGERMPAQLLTYRCPHCQHAIEVDPALAEQRVTCSNPKCGRPFPRDVPTAKPERLLVVPPDIHERPREPEPIRPEDPAAGQTEVTPEAFGEKEVLTVQPVMFRRY